MQRYTWCDRIIQMQAGEYAQGIRGLTYTEQVYHDHFVNFPVLPGVLYIQAMLDVAHCLATTSWPEWSYGDLISLERVKFRHFAHPGDRLTITVTVVEAPGLDAVPQFSGKIHMNDNVLAATADHFTLDAVLLSGGQVEKNHA